MCGKSLTSDQKSIVYTGYFSLPNDPLDIQTMEHYELSLALQTPWFEIDDGGRAFHGIVNKWRFDDSKRAYLFEINPKAKWSNGTNITAEDLMFNLLRVKIKQSRFFKMIDARVDYSGLQVINDRTLLVPTKNGQPNDEIFQRLSSQAFGIIHPSDVDKQGRVKSANITSGPYRIDNEKTTGSTIYLEKNEHFLFSKSDQPDSVIIKVGKQISLQSFIDGKTDDSFITTYSLITKEEEEQIRAANLPAWTRGYDRVSSLRVNSALTAEKKKKAQEALKYFGKEWLESDRHTGLSSSVGVAESLQPFGYPLKYDMTPNDYGSIPKPKSTVFKAVTYETKVTELQINQINKVAADIGIEIEWTVVTKSDFYNQKSYLGETFDFVLISWGVADNDPGTWMSLVLKENGPFMDVSAKDIENSKHILQLKNRGEVIAGYIEMLKKKQLEGNYIPLYHFSTLTLGRENLSFDSIGDLDETVEFAKISIKE